MPLTRLRRVPLALAFLAAVLASACVPGAGAPDPAMPVAEPFSGGYPTYRDPASGITTILGAPDLGVGTFRVAFALSDRSGLVRAPGVEVQSYRVPRVGSEDGPVQTTTATFAAFPDGSRGLYSTALTFDRAGTWGIRVRVPRADGSLATVALRFPVAAHASAPSVGDAAPATKNRTARDVSSLKELSSGTTPTPALYEQTVAGAITARRPFVVVFASPAFCTTPLCGPQVEDLGAIAPAYAGRADFIHIDTYQHPELIRGDLEHAERSPFLKQWGLKTDEWTFVVGADGKIAARFEAYVPRAELEAALQRVIASR